MEVNMKKQIFLSYDINTDADLKDIFLKEQEKSSFPFEVINFSSPMNNNEIVEKISKSIKKSDLVIVLCSSETENAENVTDELSVAIENNIPYILLNGKKETNISVPKNASQQDCIYTWSTDNLHLLYYKLFLM